MWTYLRLLGIQESLARFLETERGEDLPGLIKTPSGGRALIAEVDGLKSKGVDSALDTNTLSRFTARASRKSCVKRQQRIGSARKPALGRLEQDRLDAADQTHPRDAVGHQINDDALTAA